MSRQRYIGALDGTGRGRMIEQDVPELKPGMVEVKVHASLISPGTELNAARTARKEGKTDAGIPKPFGYQNAGVITDVSDDVTALKPGDRVACMGAGYAQHTNIAVVPQNLCCLLPDKVSFEEGAYCHLAITSMHALRRLEPELGEYLLVVGMGLVGQMAARLGQIAGAYSMGWDMNLSRLEIARAWGIDGIAHVGIDDCQALAKEFTRGLGFDMAIMAFGGDGTQALEQVNKVMKVSPDTHQMGRLGMVGGLKTLCGWGAALGNLDLRCCSRTGPGYHDDDWETGKSNYPETFMRWTTKSNLELALRFMSEGKLEVKCLTTHRLPLAEIDTAVSAHIEAPNQTLGTLLLY